jgi:hypothetical protein
MVELELVVLMDSFIALPNFDKNRCKQSPRSGASLAGAEPQRSGQQRGSRWPWHRWKRHVWWKQEGRSAEPPQMIYEGVRWIPCAEAIARVYDAVVARSRNSYKGLASGRGLGVSLVDRRGRKTQNLLARSTYLLVVRLVWIFN